MSGDECQQRVTTSATAILFSLSCERARVRDATCRCRWISVRGNGIRNRKSLEPRKAWIYGGPGFNGKLARTPFSFGSRRGVPEKLLFSRMRRRLRLRASCLRRTIARGLIAPENSGFRCSTRGNRPDALEGQAECSALRREASRSPDFLLLL